MRITKENIDYNVARLAKEQAAECWEISDIKHFPEMALAYIHGMTDLADVLKEVLSQ